MAERVFLLMGKARQGILRRKKSGFSRPAVLVLLAAVLWTFFQPAFTINIAAFQTRSWSAWQLGQSIYDSASRAIVPRKQSALDVRVNTGFTDLLKKIFPFKKAQWNWKSVAGFAFGIFIPMALALAYFCFAAGAGILFIKSRKSVSRLAGFSVLMSTYALAGVIYLGEKAEDLFRASAAQASQGMFGFLSRPLVPQLSLEPGIAMILLPILAASFWLLSIFVKK